MAKRWIGRWIFAVAVIHSLFGLIVFRTTWRTLLGEGLVNTVNGQAEREFPFWFLAFGLLTLIFGALVDWIEGHRLALPAFVGWGLLALTLVFLVVMPISGGWLLIPAVAGAIRSSRRGDRGS